MDIHIKDVSGEDLTNPHLWALVQSTLNICENMPRRKTLYVTSPVRGIRDVVVRRSRNDTYTICIR